MWSAAWARVLYCAAAGHGIRRHKSADDCRGTRFRYTRRVECPACGHSIYSFTHSFKQPEPVWLQSRAVFDGLLYLTLEGGSSASTWSVSTAYRKARDRARTITWNPPRPFGGSPCASSPLPLAARFNARCQCGAHTDHTAVE